LPNKGNINGEVDLEGSVKTMMILGIGTVLKTKEAALRGNVCCESIIKWVRDGKVKGHKRGLFWWIEAKSLDRYLVKRKNTPRKVTPRKRGKDGRFEKST